MDVADSAREMSGRNAPNDSDDEDVKKAQKKNQAKEAKMKEKKKKEEEDVSSSEGDEADAAPDDGDANDVPDNISDASDSKKKKKEEGNPTKIEVAKIEIPTYTAHFYSEAVAPVSLPALVKSVIFRKFLFSKTNAGENCFTFFGFCNRQTTGRAKTFKRLLIIMTYEHILLLNPEHGDVHRCVRLLDVVGPIAYVLNPPAIHISTHNSPDLALAFESNLSMHERDVVSSTTDDFAEKIQALNDRCIHDVKDDRQSQKSDDDEYYLDIVECATFAQLPKAKVNKTELYDAYSRATILTVLNNEHGGGDEEEDPDKFEEMVNRVSGKTIDLANRTPFSAELDKRRKQDLLKIMSDLKAKIDYESHVLAQTEDSNAADRKNVAFLSGVVQAMRTRLHEVMSASKPKRSLKNSSPSNNEDDDDGGANDDVGAVNNAALDGDITEEQHAVNLALQRRTAEELAVGKGLRSSLENQLHQAQEHAARSWLRKTIADARIASLSDILLHLDYIASSVVNKEAGAMHALHEQEAEERTLRLELATLQSVERRTVGNSRKAFQTDPLIKSTVNLARMQRVRDESMRVNNANVDDAVRVLKIGHEKQIAELNAANKAELAAIQARTKISFRAQHAEARKYAGVSKSGNISTENEILEATTAVTRRLAEQIEHERNLRETLYQRSKHLEPEISDVTESNLALKDMLSDMMDEYGQALEVSDSLRIQLMDMQMRLSDDRREREKLLQAKRRKLSLSTQHVVRIKDNEIANARALLKELQESVEKVARAFGHRRSAIQSS